MKVFSMDLVNEKSFQFLYTEPVWDSMLVAVRAIEKPIVDSVDAIVRQKN